MSRPICVYIAGPYRSPTDAGVQRNIRRAALLAQRVWKTGCVAVCPHLNSANFSGIVPEQWILDGYLELVSRCDAVVLTAKWRESEGTLAEMAWAEKYEIPVFADFRSFATWLERFDD